MILESTLLGHLEYLEQSQKSDFRGAKSVAQKPDVVKGF
jgi:hypothetical protein